jgi:hypothetical protein
MVYIMKALRDGMDIGTPRERRRVRGLPLRFRRHRQPGKGLQLSLPLLMAPAVEVGPNG